MAITTYLSVITLNVNGLTIHSNQKTVMKWIKNQDPSKWGLQVIHFRPKDTCKIKVKGWKNIMHMEVKKKSLGSNKCISHKIDFKVKAETRDEGHYTIIKEIL